MNDFYTQIALEIDMEDRVNLIINRFDCLANYGIAVNSSGIVAVFLFIAAVAANVITSNEHNFYDVWRSSNMVSGVFVNFFYSLVSCVFAVVVSTSFRVCLQG